MAPHIILTFLLLGSLFVATLALPPDGPPPPPQGHKGCKSYLNCENPFKPKIIYALGIEGYQDAFPVYNLILDGWREVEALTGETIEQTRQEALNWYAERYGLNNTVLSYDPTTGLSVLPQGVMVPTRLNASGEYHLLSNAGVDIFDGIECPTFEVIEWVWFSNANFAGQPYGGTYGKWYKSGTGVDSLVSLYDVASIGRYVIHGSNGKTKVLNFGTWLPCRKTPEGSYIVDNKIFLPENGDGHGHFQYAFWYPPGSTLAWTQIHGTVSFPFIESPPIPTPYNA